MLPRMRTLLLTLAGLVTGLTAPHLVTPQDPTTNFDLEIDGTKHRVAAGKKTKIKIGDKEHTVQVTVAPYRQFSAHGMQFDFPSSATYEHELDEDGTESWSIDTPSLTFMIHRFTEGQADMMAKIMLNATIESLEAEAKTKRRTMKFGSTTYKGSGARVPVAGSELDIAMFGIPDGDHAIVITVQNVLTDEGKIAPDSEAAMATIRKTFQKK